MSLMLFNKSCIIRRLHLDQKIHLWQARLSSRRRGSRAKGCNREVRRRFVDRDCGSCMSALPHEVVWWFRSTFTIIGQSVFLLISYGKATLPRLRNTAALFEQKLQRGETRARKV